MNEIIPRLYVSNWQEAQQAKAEDKAYVITVAVDAPFTGDQKFDLIDGPGNNPDTFKKAVQAVVDAYLDLRKPVLVHCVSGRSRSVAVTIAALMKIKQWDLCHAYDFTVSVYDKARIHPYLALLLIYG